MKSLQELQERFKKKPTDILGLDVGSSGFKAIRMKKSGDSATVAALDVLPPHKSDGTEGSPAAGPLSVPSSLRAKYVCLAVSGETAVIKILTFPGHFDQAAEAKVVDSLGLDQPDNYRISYKLIVESRTESRVLAVALPEAEAKAALSLFPIGTPAPLSLEIAGIATLSAFLHGPATKHAAEAVGVIDFGALTSTFGLFNKNNLSVIRRFSLGTNTLLTKVQESLGVDGETARGIIADRAFDISQAVSEVMEPLVKQILVSRDFLERRETCKVAKIYASGGLAFSQDAMDEIKTSTGIEIERWNPLEGLNMPAGMLNESLAGQEWRFSGAVGAVLATFEDL